MRIDVDPRKVDDHELWDPMFPDCFGHLGNRSVVDNWGDRLAQRTTLKLARDKPADQTEQRLAVKRPVHRGSMIVVQAQHLQTPFYTIIYGTHLTYFATYLHT